MAHPSRPRRIRKRKFSRLRKLSDNLLQFLTAQGARLASSATGRTFTVDHATGIFSSTAHGFLTAKGPIVVSNSGGALPAGLVAGTLYWPIKIDADTFYLATSRKNAAVGTALAVTGNGTGTQTAKYGTSAHALMDRLRSRSTSYRAIVAVTDIDNL